jgi:hypothetical protein
VGDLFKNSYDFQKQQLINVVDEATLNENIAGISSTLTSLKNTSINNPVVDSENQRLNTKDELIKSMSSSQDRMNALNESYRKKNWEYVKILIVVAISLFVILGISTFLRNIIPDIFIDLITAVIIGLVVIYAIMIYKSISSRSAIDFDKLNLSNPMTNSKEQDEAKKTQKIISAGESGDILGSIETSSGASACGVGTKWCVTQNKCFVDDDTFATKCPEGFDIMNVDYLNKSAKKDYTESEYTNYSPYK